MRSPADGKPDDPVRVTKKIREAGMKAAIAISPKTDSDVITSQLVESGLDMILVMTVEPGKPQTARYWIR